MPLYEYECSACQHRFEVLQKFSDEPVKICVRCSAPVRKLLSSPAIQFKGTGWYVTDYGKSGGASENKSKSDGDSDKGSKESKPAESKTVSSSSTSSTDSTTKS